MEVVILGGLVGLGYLFNDNNENNNPVNTTIKDDPSVPNGLLFSLLSLYNISLKWKS